MRRYIVGILIFFVAVVACDIILGCVFDYLFTHAKGGDTASQHYVADVMQEQVIVMGSSRATHHYVPSVITDSTGLSCYNCGRDGNGIIYHYGRFLLLSQRYHPRMVIYDVSYAFDIVKEKDNLKYVDFLKPFARRDCIRQYVGEFAPKECWKQLSSMFRYNGKLGQIIMDNVRPLQQNLNGYKPFHQVMDYEPEKEPETEMTVDTLKLYYLQSLIRKCKADNVALLVCVSPLYLADDAERYEPVLQLCLKEHVPFVSYYRDPMLSCDRKYYKDQIHLNDTGATLYTRSLMRYIKDVLDGTFTEGVVCSWDDKNGKDIDDSQKK